jgi:hypothetical protein
MDRLATKYLRVICLSEAFQKKTLFNFYLFFVSQKHLLRFQLTARSSLSTNSNCPSVRPSVQQTHVVTWCNTLRDNTLYIRHKINTLRMLSTAFFLNPSHQSVHLNAIPLFVARQRFGKNITATKNTQARTEELLDASFSMRCVFASKENRISVLPRTCC